MRLPSPKQTTLLLVIIALIALTFIKIVDGKDFVMVSLLIIKYFFDDDSKGKDTNTPVISPNPDV